MSLKVAIRRRDELEELHFISELAVAVEKGEASYATMVRPATADEPLSLQFRGRAVVKTSSQNLEGAAYIAVTRLRLLLLITSGMNAKGLNSGRNEIAIVSVDRSDLSPPRTFKTMFGKVKRVDLAGAGESFEIRIPHIMNFTQFLEAMAPEYGEQLGDAVADELEASERQKLAEEQEAAAAAEEQSKALNTKRFEEPAGSRPVSRLAKPIGGLLDHLATWRYRVSVSPEQCVNGFTDAFSGSGGLVAKAKWTIDHTSRGAVAVYEGRRGLAAAATAFSQTAQSEEEGAIGSEIRFELEEEGDGYIICAMWLESRTTRIGFTSDGRFFRPYMRAVETHLRQVDPTLQVVKD